MKGGFGRKTHLGQSLGKEALEASGATMDVISLNKGTKFLDGGRAVVKVNNRIFGFFFGVTWNIDLEHTPIYTIDDYMPYELSPRKIRITGSLSSYVVPGESPQHHQIASDMMSFLFDRYISIKIEDSNTRAIVFQTDQAIITRCRGSIQAQGPATLTLDWEAISWEDNYDPLDQEIEWLNEDGDSDSNLALKKL
jgi:hypothetical protein